MPATVVLGAQWGDEGKGKIIDVLASGASWTIRFQGGANAGHTIRVGGERFALHLIPSGAVRREIRCGLGWGMVIDPDRLLAEIRGLEERGITIRDRLLVDARATLLLPHHAALDGSEEERLGAGGLGTTRRGIGPAYADRAARRALLVADLLEEDGRKKLRDFHERADERIRLSGSERIGFARLEERWALWREEMGPLIGDCSAGAGRALRRGERVLFEGAQGAHLDLYAGTYPFVTSSSTLTGGACAGLGVGPAAIDRVVGVVKAYSTRVGTGPFPTEASAEEAALLRDRGGEVGTTTGRPRRCGWLDLPMVRAAVRWNGITELALTKADVLNGRRGIPVAVAYRFQGERLEEPPPFPAALGRLEPVYEEWPGWGEIGQPARAAGDLPEKLLGYAERVGAEAGAPVRFLSIGPERDETVDLSVS
ncbi:MAG: adenylosuccinate synthase [Candidatus Eisenbacteria bacterium]|nr:adenylosuccinate synthase [Candidatus Eisenbacteria bacterium]